MSNFGVSGAKQIDGVNASVDFEDVKLDKLYSDANKSEKASLTSTQSEAPQNYNAGTANTYGGRSSSQTETMDFSTTVDESKTADSVSTTNTNASSGPTTSGSSRVNDASQQQVNQTSNNSNLNDSSNINNSTNVDSSKAPDINSTNQSSNSTMNGNSLSSNNESKSQNDMNVKPQDNKTPFNAKNNNATSNQTSSSTNVNMTSNQNANQGNNNSGTGVSFDMPENSFDSSASNNNVEDATKVTITTINSWGQEVVTEIDVDTYRMLLESFGLNEMDIEQVLNGKISQEELFEQIENDEDNTRRVDMIYASYLQAYGLEYNNIADLEQAINDDTNRLNELYKQKLEAENYEIDAIMNFITRLKMGENLDDILNSTVVAWEYTDENGNINYKYEDPYMSGYVDDVSYTPLTFEEMYKDSELLAELRANLTAETIKPLFSKNEKTIYRWTETEAQEQYFYSISDKYGDLVNNRNENLENINSEIKQLEVKVSTYQNICDAIKEEVDYYINNVDSYLHADDFDTNNTFNSEALETIKALQEANKNKIISPSDYDAIPTIRVTSKEEIVNLISCMINGEGGNLSNGYLSVDGVLFPVTANDDLFNHYLQWLPFVSEEEKLIFNYIYNTEGIDGAYNYLNDVLSSEVDKRWLANKTLEDQEYASEHPILASIGSVLITPFEGIGAMYYSLNSYFTGQKIRRVDVYSSGDIWRTQVASDIAKNSETLSFLYSTGMSMIDSLELIGISVATGGVATPLISAATMGSRAYVSTLNDALDRGLSDGEAVALAFTSSVVETAMESYSVSHLLNLEEKLSENVLKLTNKIASNISNPTIANLVTKSFYVGASALSQGFVEGEEEFTTEILNYVADIFIAKDLSNYTQSINNYILNGDDENTALIKTMKDFSNQAFQSFLGGFVSGLTFGSFGGTKTTVRASYAIANDMYNKLNGTTKAQQFAQVLEINRSELQVYNDVVQKDKNGEVLTDSEISFLKHGTIEMQISKYMKDKVNARLRGILQDVKRYTNSRGMNNGHPIDVATIDDYSKAAHDFAEGNKDLEALLLTSHQQGVETIASCGGHIDITGENSPYVAFKMTPTFSKYLPSILSALDGKNFDITFQRNSSSSSYPSIVAFYARSYDNELFNTLNSIIGTAINNSLVLNTNMQKLQNIYDLLSNLDIQMELIVKNKMYGSTSELSYSIVSDFLTEKVTLTSEELTDRLSIIEEHLKTIQQLNYDEKYNTLKLDFGSIFKKTNSNMFDKINQTNENITNEQQEWIKKVNTAIKFGKQVSIDLKDTAKITSKMLAQISNLSKLSIRMDLSLSDFSGKYMDKYQADKYIKRVTYSGNEAYFILEKIEQLEAKIDKNLPITQRAKQIYELIASEIPVMRNRPTKDHWLVCQSLRGITSNNSVGEAGLVCAGYSSLFRELCTRCGIKCDYIRGKAVIDLTTGKPAGGHAWNVFIDENNNPIPVDVTWHASGGKDWFGGSEKFQQMHIPDSDEMFKNYTIPANTRKNVDPISIIENIISTMDKYYGDGKGLKALQEYIATKNPNKITRQNGARASLQYLSFDEIENYISSISITNKNTMIQNILSSMSLYYGVGQGLKALKKYVKTGNELVITRKNGARDSLQYLTSNDIMEYIDVKTQIIKNIISTMDKYYGEGMGLKALEDYVKNKNELVITRQNGARDSLKDLTTFEIKEFMNSINIEESTIFDTAEISLQDVVGNEPKYNFSKKFDALYDEELSNWYNNLSDVVKDKLRVYIGLWEQKGLNFGIINSYLKGNLIDREGNIVFNVGVGESRISLERFLANNGYDTVYELQADLKDICDIIRNSCNVHFKEKTIIYRATGKHYLLNFIGELEPGETIETFLSDNHTDLYNFLRSQIGTTYTETSFVSAAIDFNSANLSRFFNIKKIRLELEVDENNTFVPLGMFNDEAEILLSDMTSFQIIDVYKDDDKIVVKLKSVPITIHSPDIFDRINEAIESNEKLDEIIKEIKLYTDWNLPVGIHSLVDIKNALIDALISSNTLKNISENEFLELISDEYMYSKISVTDEFKNFFAQELQSNPESIANAFANYDSKFLAKIFDNKVMQEYFSSLTDEQYRNIFISFNENCNQVLLNSITFINRFLDLSNDEILKLININNQAFKELLNNNVLHGNEFMEELYRKIKGQKNIDFNLVQTIINLLDSNSEYEIINNRFTQIIADYNEELLYNLTHFNDFDVPSNGIIEDNGYFTITFIVAGVEKTIQVYSKFSMNLLDIFAEYKNDIINNNLTIKNIVKDSVKSEYINKNLYFEDYSKYGTYTFTFEIDGEIVRVDGTFEFGSCDLRSVAENRDIKSIKLLSMMPKVTESSQKNFVQSYNKYSVQPYSEFTITFEINGQTYIGKLVADYSGTLNVDQYIKDYLGEDNFSNVKNVQVNLIQDLKENTDSGDSVYTPFL